MLSRSRIVIASCAAALLAAGAAYALTTTATAQAVAVDPYTFRNVEIHGGGFVPGIIFNKTTPNLLYARTDIGGAYRWNPTTGRWIPLNDSTSNADYNLLGIDGLATDPVDPNRLYLIAGTYTQSWAGNAAILRSTDRGATFARTNLPFKAGGNEPGRSIGERIMVDPNRNATVYMGTRNDGLWRSTDFGVTWARVTSFPVTGNGGIGVGWIEFDKSSATAGNTTQRIYVGVAGSSNTIYRSTDGGTTWALVPGQPTAGIPHHGKLASGNGTLYVTYGDLPGPYEMYGGQVWKMNTATGAWTNITPLVPYQNGEQGFGYAGLAVDGTNPNIIMVATMSRWGPVDDIFRTTNGGTSWVSVTSRKVMDTTAAPYLNWHGTPKLGWMIGSLEIDPFNSNKFLYGTGATIFGSDQATTLDAATGTITISSRAHGLEETAVLDIVSPPSGPPLISALGDIGAFRHDSLTVVPPTGMADNPIYGSTTSLDFAELAPSVVLRIGNQAAGADRRAAYSTNGGTSWQPVAAEPESPTGAGFAAVSADGASFVWAPEQRSPSYSLNRGTTWAASGGNVPAGAQVRSDRVNATKFYAFMNGNFYVSTNRGQTFAIASSGLPTGSVYIKAVPGREGDVWVTTGYGGLYHTTNSGTTVTKVENVTEAYTVGYGMAAPGQTYPAVFINGIIDGVSGVFRSDNAGTSWVRVNDDAHQYGWIGRSITGDPRVYGRYYVSTNGRGIIYGDRSGTTSDTTAPTTPGTPTASAITSSGATLSWTASTDSGGSGLAGYDVINASNTVVATSAANSVTLTGLTASTQYVLRVRARDGAGNVSTPSAAVTFTTTAGTDTTVPTTPGTPTASGITTTGATLSWTASTDSGGSGLAGYNVYREAGATDVQVGTPTTNSFTVTGLTAATQYQFYVRARDGAGNLSANSGVVTFTTTGTADTTPPTTPGTPTASAITSTSATLTWTASTDGAGSGLAGYNVYREAGATDVQVGTPTTNSFSVTGLTAATQYQFYVRARDNAGNLSANSGLVTFTTSSAPAGGCSVAYSITGTWGGGFQGLIRITNNSATAINPWTLAFTFPNGQTMTQSWGGSYTQTGANVTIVPPTDWNRNIAANGGFVEIGFLAGSTGTNNEPTAFTVNGSACTVV